MAKTAILYVLRATGMHGPASKSRAFIRRIWRAQPFFLIRRFIIYLFTGKSFDGCWSAMVSTYCRTSGLSSDILHKVVTLLRPPYSFSNVTGALGALDSKRSQEIAAAISNNGYYVFPHLLNPDLCKALLSFAQNTECRPFPFKGDLSVVFDEKHPITATCKFTEEALLDNKAVQNLMADVSLLNLAQQYLGCAPHLDIVTMWWSAASAEPCAPGAQLYHFDMDGIRWLKFLFYLTDVTTDTGPHCFISGTHVRYAKPKKLLEYNYARITDEEMAESYPRDRFKELLGPCGTIIAVDTRGFHKGKQLKIGCRLVLELEYCDSRFGTQSPTVRLNTPIPQLVEALKSYPRVFSRFQY